jgi:hypothetical protein
MIDTDKYTGHTPAPWVAKHDLVETEALYGGKHTHIINSDGWRVWLGESDDINDEPRDDIVDTTLVENSRGCGKELGEADAKLIADAPLLLAEVKRWHKVYEYIHHLYSTNRGTMPVYDLKELIDEVVVE